jgi:hypothetical protein
MAALEFNNPTVSWLSDWLMLVDRTNSDLTKIICVMAKIVSSFNYVPEAGEVNNDPSLTVPGMSLTLKEIVERFVRTGELKGFDAVWNGEEDFPDISKMDALEKLDYKRDLEQFILEFNKAEAPKRDDDAYLKHLESEVNRIREQKENPPNDNPGGSPAPKSKSKSGKDADV